MTSHPPSSCCTRGFKHEGTATGEIKTIDNIETYFAYPPNKASPDRAILFITDVLGIYPNAQFLADDLAARGYLVAMPDLFRGDALTISQFENQEVDFPTWLGKHTPETMDPIIERLIKYLREEKGVKKLGAVGYCYGVKFVCRFLKEGKIDVGYGAHPSFVTPEELAGITGPLSISAAEIDTIFPTELRHQSEEILAKTKLPYQINLFSGVEHGFSVRADLSVKQNLYAKEQAFLQAAAWFDFYL